MTLYNTKVIIINLYSSSNHYLLYQVFLKQPYIYDIETNKAMALWLLSDLPIDYQYQDHGEAYYILKDENNLIWGNNGNRLYLRN